MKHSELEQLLGEMTLSEKIGQLVQLTPNFFEASGEITGPLSELNMTERELYQIGSVLGTHTADEVYRIQKDYLARHRLQIPLIFMADVIHGYETIFPIPLALASSWDPAVIEQMAELSAIETTEAGVHVTFSPMADLVRDARWGRVLESNGEDPYLNSELTRAYVRGYQGTGSLAEDQERIAACVKHFIGYGASEAGRDYNTVDLSDLVLYQDYLPSFQAALEEGAKLVMTAFNTIKGIPASANRWALQEVLREQLGFDVLVISDWAAIDELRAHGVAGTKAEAAQKAINASVDMDMMTNCYQNSLAALLEAGQIERELIDAAVMRVLTLKNDLGLFEDPYRGLPKDKQRQTFSTEMQAAAREIAHESIVLLKNEQVLPIAANTKVALLGPKADSQDVLGAWSWIGKQEAAVSLAAGLQDCLTGLTVVPTKALNQIEPGELTAMKQAASTAEVVILALGESSEESGEAASKTSIRLPRAQEELVKEIAQVNSNLVVVLFNGRPLDLSPIVGDAAAIVEAWFPGTQAGTALADILTGKVNPSAKLPMSFPRTTGQLPFSYNQMRTGRPLTEQNRAEKYCSKYLDCENDALFPFGFGLSYTDFTIELLAQSAETMQPDTAIEFQVKVTNIGKVAGKEIVQLYLRDEVTEVVRPVKELKQFQSVVLTPQTSETVTMKLTVEDIKYIHSDLTSSVETGAFSVFIGNDSRAPLVAKFDYVGGA